VDGAPVIGRWPTQEQMPATSPLSDRLSRDLKKLGFSFVGSTIVYSYLQAVGLINDHVVGCFCCPE
jgi:DNA-3-methyladenine glycosylase I